MLNTSESLQADRANRAVAGARLGFGMSITTIITTTTQMGSGG